MRYTVRSGRPPHDASRTARSVRPSSSAETDVDLTVGDWADELERHAQRTAEAWSDPQAWIGLTAMGSPMELPAPLIGAMVLGEFVVHGWDLARSTGQDPVWDDDLLEYLYVEVAKTAEQGARWGCTGRRSPCRTRHRRCIASWASPGATRCGPRTAEPFSRTTGPPSDGRTTRCSVAPRGVHGWSDRQLPSEHDHFTGGAARIEELRRTR